MEFTDLYGSAREAEAALGCDEGTPHLWPSPTVTLETLVYALANANDCIDNGEMAASTTIRPTVHPASGYPTVVGYPDAGWYA